MDLRILLLLSLVSAVARAGDFARDVAPILERRCMRCHSATKPKGDFSLTSREAAFRGGESGPAVTPGKPESSPLLEQITGDKPAMPAEGPPLTAAEVATIRAWIAAGAEWPDEIKLNERAGGGADWWSFKPVRRPVAPAVKNAAWSRNEVDRFVLAALEAKDLAPSPEASRRTLIRRLTFDLLGLPPTPAEVEAFVNDTDPQAYERLVERLLESPHYGEHWARHWLDVVRFTESDGFEDDAQRFHAWPYRDYVIRAFNHDKPYDKFVIEQIAGDAIQPLTADALAGVGMLVAGPWDAVARVTPSKFGRLQSREEQLEEIVSAVGQTFLGLTVSCARCHDHKFDPIPQTDYYQIKAVFEGVDHGHRARVHGVRRLMGADDEQKWNEATAPLRERISAAEKTLADWESKLRDAKGDAERVKELQPQRDAARGTLDALKKELATGFPVDLVFVGERKQPPPTVLFKRGDIKQPGAIMKPAGLSQIAPVAWNLDEKSPEATRRLEFARWIARPEHPLTARVFVNRVWQAHFGTGLVDTPSDFGFNGGRPTHPELLDQLASDFVAGGWSVKALQRQIVGSATYRQLSVPSPDDREVAARHARAAAVDADARLLWRFPPQRLSGETVRDSLLAFSGALNREPFGPSFKPYTVSQLNTYFYHLFDKDEPQFNRRTIYRMHLITGRNPFLDALDCPSPSVTTPKRAGTVTPQQALALMNDGFLLRQAEQTAARLTRERPELEAQVDLAFETVFHRAPTAAESTAAVALAREHGLATVCWSLFNAAEFLYLR